MPYYRRSRTAGATYFFTVVTYQRQKILCDEIVRNALRQAINSVRKKRPFQIDAWVLLPDHLHCIWTLPQGDNDYSSRWSMIKRKVSTICRDLYKRPELLNASKQKRRESTLWQRRFWEHQIRDELDYQYHVDYIHYNPVKHGLCEVVVDWSHSTFHRYVERGVYPLDWAGVPEISDSKRFGE